MISREDQIDATRADLTSDAISAERQAATGAFYPEKDITPASLLAYALQCRVQAGNPEGTLKDWKIKGF